MVTAPLIMSKNIGYDPHKDFAPISRLVTIAPILTTYIKDDTARWVKIVKERKIRIE